MTKQQQQLIFVQHAYIPHRINCMLSFSGFQLKLSQAKLRRVELSMKLHLCRGTVCHLPYRITQFYLPPDTSEHTSP